MAVRRRPARGAPGQHFLRSSRLASELVRDAGIGGEDLVVELGAGTGILTRALAETGARVQALEVDPSLTHGLRARFGRKPNVTVVEADIQRFPWPAEPFKVVSNLPFAGSGAILDRLLGDPGIPLRSADVVVQWELASKMAAVWPATMRSAYWRAWYDLAIARRLSRTAFTPIPKVDAAVLRVTRRPAPLVAVEAHADYRRFVAEAFRTRGPLAKGLRRSLTPVQFRRLAAVLAFAQDALPRDLDARQWAGLFTFTQRPRGGTRAAPR